MILQVYDYYINQRWQAIDQTSDGRIGKNGTKHNRINDLEWIFVSTQNTNLWIILAYFELHFKSIAANLKSNSVFIQIQNVFFISIYHTLRSNSVIALCT